MKSLFAIPGCSFIVTISTSAWASFEQRGLHVRTVFDSSFDEIVEAAPLSFLEARSMLRGRGAVLSDTQVMLVNIAAGGVARDVIRNARALGDLSDLASTPPSTWGAVQGFVMLEARSKVEAAILDIRGMEAGETGESTVALLDEIRAGFDNLDFDDLMAELERHCSSSDRLLVRHSDASTRETNGDRPDPAPPGDSAPRLRVLSRTVAYLGFLRLLELAFSDDGAVAALASPEPVLYGEFSRAQLRPLEELLETKEWLGTGCATAIVRLREAHERLLSARSAPVAPESGAP
jgi:hypothetical protein